MSVSGSVQVSVDQRQLRRHLVRLEQAIEFLNTLFRKGKASNSRQGVVVSHLEDVLHFLESIVEGEGESSRQDRGGGQGQSRGGGGGRGGGGRSRNKKRPNPRHNRSPSPIRTPTPLGSQRVYSAESHGPSRIEQQVVPGSCSFSSDVVKRRRGQLLSAVSEDDQPIVFSKHISHLIVEHGSTTAFEPVVAMALNVSVPSVDSSDPVFGSAVVSRLKPLTRLNTVIANACSHTVGRLLRAIVDSEGVSSTSLAVQVCNAAEEEKQQSQREVLTACATSGCAECQASLDSQADSRPPACSKTQVLLRLRGHEFVNFTPTYLKQAMEFATLPLRSPLVLSADPHSDTRQILKIVRQLKPSIEALCGSCTTGASPVYHVRGDPIVSVHYVDGDGGYLDVQQIPGLEDYARDGGVVPCCLTTHAVSLIPFRELHHDAIELGHCYHVRDSTDDTVILHQHLGYEALVKARANVANAVKVVLVPHGTDQSGERLLLEVFTLEKGEDCFRSTAVRLIESGLSFPVSDSPAVFQQAFRSAGEAKVRVHQCDQLLLDEPLLPWNLKQRLVGVDTCFSMTQHAGERSYDVTVTNVSLHLNEANVLVLPSLIPGAGMGLFFRPPRRQVTVPVGRRICLYSDQPLEPGEEPTDSDYLFAVGEGSRLVQFNPAVYDGRTIGRFVNQGGLIEGMKQMVLDSNSTVCSSFSRRGTEVALQSGCNVRFKREQPSTLVVEATRPIAASPNCPVELLGSYGYSYWLCIVLNKPTIFDFSTDEVAKCVLWVLLSSESNWSSQQRREYLGGHDIPEAVRARFESMPCPYSVPPRRR